MRLGVLGSINRDSIATADGQVHHSLGGVLYTACAAAHLAAAPDVSVWPIARLGRDVDAAVADLVERTPRLCPDGLLAWRGPAFHSHIEYRADGSKREVLTGDLPPLSMAELAPVLDGLDALLVNFITGLELTLDTLAAIRRRLAGPLLMDLHSLTLGRRTGGERYWRRPPDWERWVEPANAVQMNEAEAAILMGRQPGVGTARLTRWVRDLVGLGPDLAVVTRGPRSALAAARCGGGATRDLVEVPGPAALSSGGGGDPTGCGDVFLAGLGVAAAAGCGPRQGLRLASRAASANYGLSGLEQLHCLSAMGSAAMGSGLWALS